MKINGSNFERSMKIRNKRIGVAVKNTLVLLKLVGSITTKETKARKKLRQGTLTFTRMN